MRTAPESAVQADPGVREVARGPLAASQQRLATTRARAHARCVACGTRDGGPARVRFRVTDDGGVQACLPTCAEYEGYPGMLHGGVIATLLDAAMTNCLFAHGHCGLTGDLHLRYRHPVESAGSCVVRAWIERASPPLFVLRAELWQANELRARATAKFMGQRAPGTGGRA